MSKYPTTNIKPRSLSERWTKESPKFEEVKPKKKVKKATKK